MKSTPASSSHSTTGATTGTTTGTEKKNEKNDGVGLDPYGSTRVMSNIPYIGELCLLAGVCGMFYTVSEGLYHGISLPLSLFLLTVAMVAMWYTQKIFGKFHVEVTKAMEKLAKARANKKDKLAAVERSGSSTTLNVIKKNLSGLFNPDNTPLSASNSGSDLHQLTKPTSLESIRSSLSSIAQIVSISPSTSRSSNLNQSRTNGKSPNYPTRPDKYRSITLYNTHIVSM